MPADTRRTSRRDGLKGTAYAIALGLIVLSFGALMSALMTIIVP